jgi:hypothetical protein
LTRLAGRKIRRSEAVNSDMKIYYGLASRFANETIELYESREAADDAARMIRELAPELAGDVCVVEIEVEEPSLN